jgi:GT2 family glycosyltransferase
MSEPALSVVVAVVEGGAALRGCLAALAAQRDAPPFEVIVARDASLDDAVALEAGFPQVRWVLLEAGPAPRSALEAHVAIDRRRAAGLAAARAPLVAMLADRGWPEPDWARRLVELQTAEPAAAIGGAVVNGADGALRRALFVCDFGRFEPPLHDDDPVWVSDVNVCYRRDALERLRPLWERRYQEAEVHWALRERGEPHRLRDAPRVVHRRGAARWPAALAERVQWGRNFARLRGAGVSRAHCLARIAAAPLVPFVVAVRHVRGQLRRHPALPVLAALPALWLVLACWSAGEAIGYAEAALRRRGPRAADSA